jgi:hypothetical protein
MKNALLLMAGEVAVRENCSVQKGQNQHPYPQHLVDKPSQTPQIGAVCLKTGLSLVILGGGTCATVVAGELPGTLRVPLFSGKNKQKTREKGAGFDAFCAHFYH